MPSETLEDATFTGLPPDNTPGAAADPIKPDPDAGAAAASANAKAASDKAAADKSASEKAASEKSAADKTAADQAVSDANPNLTAAATTKTEEVAGEEKKPAGMTDKAFGDWKKIKTEKSEAVKRATESEARAKEWETKFNESQKLATELETAKKELEATKQKLAEYDGEISITRVEATPQFKREVTAPIAEINAAVDDIAKRYEVPPETLLRAIQEPDHGKRTDALESAIEDFKRPDQLEIVTAAKEYHRIQKIAVEMRQNAGKRLEEITRQQKESEEKQAAQNVTEYRTAVAGAWSSLQELVPVIRKVDGKDKWNARLDAKQREIEAMDVNNLPLEVVARMAAAEKAMPDVVDALKHYQSSYEKEKARAEDAEAKNKEYLATAPSAGGGHARNGGDQNGAAARTGNFEDSVFGD